MSIIKKDFLKQILITHKHPVNALFHLIGIGFIVLGLWLHNIPWITVGIILPCMGTFYALSHKTKNIKKCWYDQLIKLYLSKIQIPFHITGYLLLIISLWQNDLLLLLIAVLIKIIGYIVVYSHEGKNLGVLFYFLVPKRSYKIIKKSIKK